MFLLIRTDNRCLMFLIHTLNSIMFLLIQLEEQKRLNDLLNFKFHYVSINSLYETDVHGHPINFKFHYVSINSYR